MPHCRMLDKEVQADCIVRSNKNVFWAESEPGVGKSIIASTIIDQVKDLLEQNAPPSDMTKNTIKSDSGSALKISAIAYIYFAFDERDNQRLESVYAHLLLQLYPKVDSLMEPLSRLYKVQEGYNEPPSAAQLLGILKTLPPTVLFVFDALDETLLKALRTLRIEAREDDMESFVRSRIKDNKGAQKRIQSTLGEDSERWTTARVKEILSSSQRMFLLVVFRVQDFCTQQTVTGMEQAAKRSDSNPGEFYTRILVQIKSQPSEQAELAFRVLAWLTFTKISIDAKELAEALAIKPGIYNIDPKDTALVEDMERNCRGLVVLDMQDGSSIRVEDEDEGEGEDEDEDDSAVNALTEEMLTRIDPLNHDFDFGSPDSEEVFGETANTSAPRERIVAWDDENAEDSEGGKLASYSESGFSHQVDQVRHMSYYYFNEEYLFDYEDEYRGVAVRTIWPRKLLKIFPQTLLQWTLIRERPLLFYTGEYSLVHLQDISYASLLADTTTHTNNSSITREVERFVKAMFPLRRQTTLSTETNSSELGRYGITRTHLAVFIGLRSVLMQVLNHPDVRINSTDRFGRTALLWALYMNKDDLADYLITRGADVTVKDRDEDMAIYYTSKSTKRDVLR
ncbi:MAG: hypothetical protein M1834_007148 [Cirrosporium novae-zelandiae]|nr:MAG: hypothetical protein M1834_007148 [Cirrosporium novae-zelandiae]